MKSTNFLSIMAFAVLAITTITFTSCNKEEDDLFQAKAGQKEIVERTIVLGADVQAEGWLVSHHTVLMVSHDTVSGVRDTAPVDWYPQFTAEPKIWRETQIGLAKLDTLPRNINPKDKTITVAYNNGVVNNLGVNLGMTVKQGASFVTVYPLGVVAVSGEWNQDALQSAPFREESTTHYVLSFNGEEFASVDQQFLMTEKLLVDDTIHTVVNDTIHNVVNDTVHHTVNDTTHTQVNDTTRVVVNDTVRVNDTIVVPTPGPSQRTLLYTDSTDRHVSTNTVGVVNNGVVTWSCRNERKYVNHYSAAPFVEEGAVVNYNKYFPYSVQATGVATSSMEGMYVPVLMGVADFSGYTVVLTAQATYADVNNPLGCTMSVTAVEINNSKLILHGTLDGTAVIAEQPITLTPDVNPIQIPEIDLPGEVKMAQLVTMYTSDLSTSGIDVLHVIVENNGVYTWYYATWRNGLTQSDFLSQTITAAQYTYLENNITEAGAYGNGVFMTIADHSVANNSSVLGTVYSNWTGSRLRLEYRNLAGATYYYMSYTMGTASGYSAGCPLKGVMAANGKISYNSLTYKLK